jgi:hypothetical protein
MKVTRHIEGDYTACWKVLMDGFINDVASATGRRLRRRDIVKGYSYDKKMTGRIGKAGLVKITLTGLIPDQFYEASFESRQGVNTLSYQLVPQGAEEFDIVYEEHFKSPRRMTDWNYKIMSFLYSRGSKKRINKVLDKVQALTKQQSTISVARLRKRKENYA